MKNIACVTYLWAAFLTLSTFALSQAHAVDIVGDTATTHLTVNGNTTASGWGLFKDGVDFGTNGEAMLNWWPGTPTAGTTSFDIKLADGAFLWRDAATATVASNKMALDTNNSLTLYKTDGTSVGLTLNPNVGITLGDGTQLKNAASLRTSALYDSSGNLAASVAADGTIKFSGAMTFGSDPSVKLNANNVAALQSTLKNLGYRENPVAGTAIKKFAINNATINSVVASGSFLYVVGDFNGGASIGGNSIIAAGDSDGFVAKIHSNGGVAWVRAIGGNTGDNAKSVSVDTGGNVLVGGAFTGTTTNLGFANLTSAGSVDGYIAKFNSIGTILWAKAIGGASSSFGVNSVCVDNSGNVVAAGGFSGATTNMGVSNITSAGNVDGFVAKLNPTGEIQWARAIGGVSYDTTNSVTMDGSGNVLIAGQFNGTLTNLSTANPISAGSQDGYIAKFDPWGAVQWFKAIGGVNTDVATSICVDSSGNVFAGGRFEGTLNNLGAANLASAGATDGFVTKLNTVGVVQWAKAIGGAFYDSTASVKVDSSGNVVVGGFFYGTTTTLGAVNLTNPGGSDGFVVRFASTGGIIDAISLGESGKSKSVSGLVLWGSDIYAWGRANSTFALGNTRVASGSFIVGWQAFNIITPTKVPVSSLAWSGSTALGEDAFAEGIDSVALGRGTATGESSFAAATGSALGVKSVAFSDGSAVGSKSVAFSNGKASGSSSVAFGDGVAAGSFSFANGYYTYATGLSATAFGQFQLASGSYSTAFGRMNTVSGDYATAIGKNLTAQSSNSFVLGSYNLIQGTMGSWIPTDDLFVIGNGEVDAVRSNAFTTLKNGQTTLTNKEWKTATDVSPGSVTVALSNPASLTDSDGNALVVEGHTLLKGKVTISQPQGDISMGIYQ